MLSVTCVVELVGNGHRMNYMLHALKCDLTFE